MENFDINLVVQLTGTLILLLILIFTIMNYFSTKQSILNATYEIKQLLITNKNELQAEIINNFPILFKQMDKIKDGVKEDITSSLTNYSQQNNEQKTQLLKDFKSHVTELMIIYKESLKNNMESNNIQLLDKLESVNNAILEVNETLKQDFF